MFVCKHKKIGDTKNYCLRNSAIGLCTNEKECTFRKLESPKKRAMQENMRVKKMIARNRQKYSIIHETRLNEIQSLRKEDNISSNQACIAVACKPARAYLRQKLLNSSVYKVSLNEIEEIIEILRDIELVMRDYYINAITSSCMALKIAGFPYNKIRAILHHKPCESGIKEWIEIYEEMR